MDSDETSRSRRPAVERPAPARAGVNALVGRTVSVMDKQPVPSYFQAIHRDCVGKAGRVHAIVAGSSRTNPLVKVGFDEGSHIVFFRLEDLAVQEDRPPVHPPRHGKRGSHLPKP